MDEWRQYARDAEAEIAKLRATISRLEAELAQAMQDAELWRAHQTRKQAVIDAGMARNPMRAAAANMCPHCYAMVGAPHEGWCQSQRIDAAMAGGEK